MTSPTLSAPTKAVNNALSYLSNAQEINALLSGTAWAGYSGSGYSTYITYSFPWINGLTAVFAGPAGAPYSNSSEPTATQHFGLNTTQQVAAKLALAVWSNVANINFQAVSETPTNVGDIRFAFSSASTLSDWWGYASYPSSYWPSGGDVWINAKHGSDQDWSVGSSNYESLMHEIGHALGLKHPFEGSIKLPSSLDNTHNTIMSYTDVNNIYPSAGYVSGKYDWITYDVNPDTPMVYDIAAIQYIYGANNTYKTGDDTYTFDPTLPFFKTIWDAGGKDTISVSNFSTACSINLTPGSYSSIHYSPPSDTGGAKVTYDGTNNLGIAFNCYIENAIGGSGNDTLIGNLLNNQLQGNGGNDTQDGQGGIDVAIYSGFKSSYSTTISSPYQSVISDKVAGRDGADNLTNIERVKFVDLMVALDVKSNQTAGSAYMLYQAAFNRAPDSSGIGYWIAQLDKGKNIVTDVAQAFVNSPEFILKYGSNPSTSSYVNNLYQNVLHRSGDSGGIAYWNQALNNGSVTKAYVLEQFATLAEGASLVEPLIAHGIEYQQWVG